VALRNADLADIVDRLGDLYELDGAVVYRVLAYRKAAARFRQTGESVERLAREGRLTELPDVGGTIAAKIYELIATGAISALERLESRIPPGLVEVMRLPGVGAKTTRRLHDELGVTSLDDLRVAAETGRVRELKGLGAKAEEKILASIQAGAAPRKGVILLDQALERAEELLAGVRAQPGCVAASEAGSLRRRRDVVGDIDLIAASEDAPALLGAFCELAPVAEVLAKGDTKATIVTNDGIQVDLRVVPPDAYGNLLQHFTGSKAHNVALREAAQQRGLKVSEWGIEDEETGEVRRMADEAEVYAALGYAWIPPELREHAGELEAARTHALPALLQVEDIRGDLHTHTTASDGHASIEEMAEAAMARGYAYLAITDHSSGVGMGMGLDADGALAHAERVREVARGLAPQGFALLSGIEVDIMAGATLDLPDEVLAQLDWVVASVHGARGQDRAALTRRLIAAAEHPHVDVIGHPSGRMLGRRDAYDFDVEALIAACVEHGTFLEVNSNPRRLDLKGEHVRLAIRAGVPITVTTDAPRTTTLDLLPSGVATARRGWATAADVANTRDWAGLQAMRKPGRPTGPI
jgi:DNA polymerase (family 10)